MYIAKIILNGFKSFANKTQINIEDSKFISIVGPNGSGKSNILDAVKWIMGESSTKQLRSSSSNDVIFAGTKDIKARNLCEVEIIFNNEEKKHPLPHNQISIKRKFARSGENSYYINNNKVRQKDIVNFFLELGISKSSLLMVNQGKIDSFINMSGKERAKLIEQVAHVAIFEERKKEALSKLNRTKENIVNLNNILAEKIKSAQILEKAAKKAIDYRDTKQVLDQHKYLKFTSDLQNGTDLLVNVKQQRREYVQKKRDKAQLLYNVNLALDDLKMQSSEKIKILDNKQQNIINLNKQHQEEIFKTKEQNLIAQGNINQYKYQLASYEKSLQKNQEVMKHLSEQNNNYRANLKQVKINNNKITNKVNELNQQNLKINQNLSISNQQINQFSFELNNLKRDLNYRDLNKIKTDVAFKTVQNCLNITKKYEPIIYDILGNNLKNLVTINSIEAAQLLNDIQKQKLSKISIYPVLNLKSKFINKHIVQVTSMKGFITLATDIVNVSDKNYEPLINFLLANIIIVDNLANANVINKQFKNAFTLVTLDLKYIYPSGVFSGGINKFSLANKINRINEIEQILLRLKNEQKNLNTTKHSNEERLIQLQKTGQENYELGIKYETKLNSIQENLTQIQQQVQQIEAEKKNVVNNLAQLELKKQHQKENNQIAKLANKIKQCKQDIEDVKKTLFTLEEQQVTQNLTKEQLNKDINEINLSLPTLEQQIDQLEQQNNYTYDQLQNFSNHFELIISEYDPKLIVELDNKLKRIGGVDFDVIKDYESVCAEIQTYQEAIGDVESSISKIKTAIKELEEKSSTRFNNYFQKINENFAQYFKYIFPNGQAKMVLNIEDNTRDIGIMASTKGSAHNVISLLSGGEKALTIIALLFAILKVSDFSFVILDEIEAALDEANVDKIARILTDFAKTTQIITITHRRGTMKQSDVLYGVSHGVIGVSQAIKIKLGEENEFSKEII